ncbi:hypothetical protein [Streptomyces sp. PSAA01]|uniref:hypothetical protein n=1 Tax=Streptomyces sp. PSAA01 TaxID=2912762 RepID=UPI001F3FF2C4|nr:hypothetical protein [Streptomyces sp. PSAA01]MCG0283988.1 hypothetical protein [Streptomyces sp. PSAA01]
MAFRTVRRGSESTLTDHLPQARAGRGQVSLKLLDVIGEWSESGEFVFELPVGFGEFADPLGQFPVADLVKLVSELLPHGGPELIAFGAEFLDLFPGHG